MMVQPNDGQQPDTTEVGLQNNSRHHDQLAKEMRFRAALEEARKRSVDIRNQALDDVLRDFATLRDRQGQ
jgi:hypothetical protein